MAKSSFSRPKVSRALFQDIPQNDDVETMLSNISDRADLATLFRSGLRGLDVYLSPSKLSIKHFSSARLVTNSRLRDLAMSSAKAKVKIPRLSFVRIVHSSSDAVSLGSQHRRIKSFLAWETAF